MEINKKPLPIGVSSFEKIRKEGYYYVDKTWLIHELLEQRSEVTLFTRPRRFGKTMNMRMLCEFFDRTKQNQNLFQGLKIEESPYFSEINTYPTIFFSFRESKGSRELLLLDMVENIRLEFWKYEFIIDGLDKNQRRLFEDCLNSLNTNDITNTRMIAKSISILVGSVSQYYQKTVILLIDEYDTPMEHAYVQGYYEELKDFFRILYSGALKDNNDLKMGILTGIQRIAKENIFSGLNNLEINTVRSGWCGEYFGLTGEETKGLLHDYDLNLTKQVAEVYNGYHFGGYEIYNPWSILNYAKTKVLQPFWVNTASNTMIKNSILKSNVDFKERFEALIEQGSTNVVLDMNTAYAESTSTATLWGLLLNAGYITLKKPYEDINRMAEEITIPNREVKTEFERIIQDYTGIGESNLTLMFHELIYRGNLEAFKRIYQQMVLTVTSYYDAKENAYHMLFLGMCCYLDGYYEVKSNIEVGTGRCDILLRAKTTGLNHFIIEFKEGEDVVGLSKKAVEQIEEKQYYADLTGNIIIMGVAHHKKKCEIVMQEKTVKVQVKS